MEKLFVEKQKHGRPQTKFPEVTGIFNCCVCGEDKDVSEFYVDNTTLRGVKKQCKSCYKKKVRIRKAKISGTIDKLYQPPPESKMISPYLFAGIDRSNTTEYVQSYVLSYLGITLEELGVKKKKGELVAKKKIFCYIMRHYTKLNLSEIGKLINMVHANVLHHINDITDKLEVKDEVIVRQVEEINKVLKHD